MLSAFFWAVTTISSISRGERFCGTRGSALTSAAAASADQATPTIDTTNRETDGGIFLLRIQPGVRGPLHKHFGSVEYYNLKGKLNFGKVKLGPGSYAYELGGFKHSEDPPEDEETITLFIVHGPLQAYEADGKP